nr:hypothetical protein [Candidatus Freyarchaeota archaeon]
MTQKKQAQLATKPPVTHRCFHSADSPTGLRQWNNRGTIAKQWRNRAFSGYRQEPN